MAKEGLENWEVVVIYKLGRAVVLGSILLGQVARDPNPNRCSSMSFSEKTNFPVI